MTEKAKLMNKIQRYGFAVVDVSLYLDSHPTCRNGLEYYNKNKQLYDEAVAEYESKYGPINMPEKAENIWKWSTTPFPWELNFSDKEGN